MSTALTLHAGGLAALISAFGQPFTVDGVSGTFRGLLDSPIIGVNPTVEAGQELEDAMLYCKREASWTPIAGTRITIRSRQYKVQQAVDEQGHWAVSLIGKNR